VKELHQRITNLGREKVLHPFQLFSAFNWQTKARDPGVRPLFKVTAQANYKYQILVTNMESEKRIGTVVVIFLLSILLKMKLCHYP